MNKWYKRASLAATAIAVFTMTSCNDDDPITGVFPVNQTENLYVVNEGNFNQGNGSITFISDDTVIQNYFQTINNRPLGDVVQSISENGTDAFIVVNNSQKVEVVNANNFQSKGVIEPLSYPRFSLTANNNKTYITNGSGAGNVFVVNAGSFDVSDTIVVGNGPEGLIQVGNNLLVANSGGFGLDSTVSIIDVNSHEVTTTTEVGKAPLGFALDVDGNPWVLCRGGVEFDDTFGIKALHEPVLVQLAANDFSVLQTVVVGPEGASASGLVANETGEDFYFILNGEVYSFDVALASRSTNAIIGGGFFYGLAMDKTTDELLVMDPKDFTVQGNMLRYDQTGLFMDSTQVGLIPNGAGQF